MPRPHPGLRGRRTAAPLRVLVALLVALLVAACVDPAAQQNTSQALVDLGDQLNAMQQENAALQQQVDSLGTVVARQDTLLRQLAGMAGLPVPQR